MNPRSQRGGGPPSQAAEALNDEGFSLSIHRFRDAAALTVNGTTIYLSRAQAGRVSRVLAAISTDLGKNPDSTTSKFETFHLKGPSK